MWFCRQKQKDKKGEPSVPDWVANHPAWVRLQHQLEYYDSASMRCQKWYKRLKFVQIALAILIPVKRTSTNAYPCPFQAGQWPCG